MTLNSYIQGIRIDFRKTVQMLNQIIDALGAFKDHYNKKFNFTKLANLLKIPASEIEQVVSLVLKFQEKFETVFGDYRIKKEIINGQIYFAARKKNVDTPGKVEINLEKDQAKLLSDVIYTFKFVKRGKGFDLKFVSSELVKDIKKLMKAHPCLFHKNGNNLVYPSETALKLGDAILSYNKSGKKINEFKVNNYNFVID